MHATKAGQTERSRTNTRESIFAGIALVIAILFWAAAFAAIRVALHAYTAGGLAFLRFALAAILLAGLSPFLRLSLPRRQDWPGLLLLALLGFVAYHLLLNYGERTTTAGSASLLIATAPLWTALFAAIGGTERLSLLQGFGSMLGFAGGVLIVVGQGGEITFSSGAILVLLAALSEAIYFVLLRQFLSRYTPLTLTAWTIVIAAILMIPFGVGALAKLPHAPLSATLAAAFLGAGPTIVSYVAWSYALQRIPASRAATALYCLPIPALAIAWLWLGEVPTLIVDMGGVLALAGVAVVQFNQRGGENRTRKEARDPVLARHPAGGDTSR